MGLLGGSWVVLSGVISRVTIVITQIRGLITPLIAAHEPPSRIEVPRHRHYGFQVQGSALGPAVGSSSGGSRALQSKW